MEGNYPNATNASNEFDTFLNGSRFWIQRVLLPLAVVVGVLGNGVTVVVLTRRRMRSSTNTYLTALAISNLLYLVFAFTLSLEHYSRSHDISNYYYWEYYPYGLWLSDAATCTSTWLTVTFTIERYIAVCHPMRGKVLCTESRARVVILLVYFLNFLATVSNTLEWRCHVSNTPPQPPDNHTTLYVTVIPTSLGLNETYKTIYYGFWSCTFVFLPLLLLGIFNSFLIFAVHNSKKQRCKMTQTDHASSTQKQENRITITLIAVVMLFMVCQIPTAIMLIYTAFHHATPHSDGDKLQRGLGNIFNFLTTVNAAANFVLYCAFSARYRRTLVATFFWRCCGSPSPVQSTINTPEFSRLVRGGTKSTMRGGQQEQKPSSNSSYKISPQNGTLQRQTSVFVTRNNDV